MEEKLILSGKTLLLMTIVLWIGLFCCTTAPQPVSDPGEKEPDNNGKTDREDTDAIETGTDGQWKDDYDIILQEIKVVIEKLNKIIRNKEYHIWLTYLTDEYKREKGDADYLRELSENPVIKNQKVVLTSLKDYFFYVVVPSRYNVRVDKINIIDKTHVKAYMYMNDKYIILDYLEKLDDEWKIGSW